MRNELYDRQTERLLRSPYWIIDFLPRKVPAENGRRYFAVEQFFGEPPHMDELYQRFARVLLKLSCYYELFVNCPPSDDWRGELEPWELESLTKGCASRGEVRDLNVLFPEEDALITLSRDDLYMTFYGSKSTELTDTIAALAVSEGLFFRKN